MVVVSQQSATTPIKDVNVEAADVYFQMTKEAFKVGDAHKFEASRAMLLVSLGLTTELR